MTDFDLPEADLVAIERAAEETGYSYYRPLREAADEHIEWARNPQARVYLGVPALDRAMQGTAPRQMCGVVGFTQGGKTVLMTHMALHNPDRGICWFTPDESRMSMIVKLTAARTGVGSRSINEMLAKENSIARELLYETADSLPNLFVCEDNLFMHEMWEACLEFEQARQMPVSAVVFDYARLLKVEGDDRSKLESLKHWTNEHRRAMFVIHQQSRTSMRDGGPITLDSGMYGGEDVFTHMIGVRRKLKWHESILNDLQKQYQREIGTRKRYELKEAIDEQLIEIDRHRYSITINLVKNKVPPCELVDEFDVNIDWATGRLLLKDIESQAARRLFA